MFNIGSIKQKFEQMNYGCSTHTLILLVPAVSLLAQKLQVAQLFRVLKENYRQPSTLQALFGSREYKKLNSVFRWHAIGSLIQVVSLIALARFSPLFLIPAAISMYELYSALKGICHEVIYFNGGLHIHR